LHYIFHSNSIAYIHSFDKDLTAIRSVINVFDCSCPCICLSAWGALGDGYSCAVFRYNTSDHRLYSYLYGILLLSRYKWQGIL